MGNMSAMILRELVSRIFSVKATEVKLSGEISPDTAFQNQYCCGCAGHSGKDYFISGFSPEKGFINLTAHVGRYYQEHGGESSDVQGTPLSDIPEIDTFLFLLVQEEGESRWSGQEQSSWKRTTVYKLPNFREYWDKVEKTDIARWEQWLSE